MKKLESQGKRTYATSKTFVLDKFSFRGKYRKCSVKFKVEVVNYALNPKQQQIKNVVYRKLVPSREQTIYGFITEKKAVWQCDEGKIW